MSVSVAAYLGMKPGVVISARSGNTIGVVVEVVPASASENSTSDEMVWCHWISDGTGQYAAGEWRPGITWIAPDQGRVLEPEEGADEILASYVAWRLTQ